jgi:hypothetical protein
MPTKMTEGNAVVLPCGCTYNEQAAHQAHCAEGIRLLGEARASVKGTDSEAAYRATLAYTMHFAEQVKREPGPSFYCKRGAR